MTETRDRLHQTTFHLQQMEKNIENIDIFRFHLRSFFVTARRVTTIMQTEFSESTGFCDWFATIQEEMKNDREMHYLYKKRSYALKEKPIKTEETGHVYYFEDFPEDLPEKDVLTLCREHLGKLQKIVDECEQTFSH